MSDFKNTRELMEWLLQGGEVSYETYVKIHTIRLNKDGVLVYSDGTGPASLFYYTRYRKPNPKPEMVKVYRPKWYVTYDDVFRDDGISWCVSRAKWLVEFHVRKTSDEWEEKEVPAEVFE